MRSLQDESYKANMRHAYFQGYNDAKGGVVIGYLVVMLTSGLTGIVIGAIAHATLY